jgi:hypothetical protein
MHVIGGNHPKIILTTITDQMKNRLLKFKGEKAKEYISQIKGKKVCNVVRRKLHNEVPLLGSSAPYLQWSGTTEEEFFVATFYGGLLMLDVQEREMMLGKDPEAHIVAITNKLKELNVSSKTTDQFVNKIALNVAYLKDGYPDDIENLRFTELMKIIGWKFASKNVKEDEFCLEG